MTQLSLFDSPVATLPVPAQSHGPAQSQGPVKIHRPAQANRPGKTRRPAQANRPARANQAAQYDRLIQDHQPVQTGVSVPTTPSSSLQRLAEQIRAAKAKQQRPSCGGLHHMGDLAKLVLMRHEMVAQRREALRA